MVRLDIHSNYRFKFMLSWLYLFAIVPIIAVILLFTKLYLLSSILLLSYLLVGIITFIVANKKMKQLNYHYLILNDEYFEIEDKYGNYLRFDKTFIYPSKGGPFSIFFDTLSFAKGFSVSLVDSDFLIDNGIEKINCYISYKTYRLLKKLNYKYIYHKLY